MIRGFYSAASGASGYQTMLNVVSNNIANTNTTGFKPQRAAFSDLVYSGLAATNGGTLRVGNGMRVTDISISKDSGAVETTGRTLDAMIEGNGYFAVQGTDGVYYTRDGNFSISDEADGAYLVTTDGGYVLNRNYERVALDGGADTVKLTAPEDEGVLLPEGETELGVFTFPNPYALEKLSEGRYAASAGSGAAEVDYFGSIRQGALERSGVDMVGEMSKLIEAQRGFQFCAQLISTADELEGVAAGLRK